jgi:hypothetical protein
MVGNATEKGTTMRNLFSVVLLPAAALLALGGCANTLPANSTAAVPSSPVVVVPSSHVADGTVISPTPYVAPAPAGTVPVVTSNGAVLNVPAGSSVVTTTTTTSGTPGSTTIYAPAQTAGIVPGALPAQLGANEILGLMVDNTASGVASNGQPYYMRFSRDGRVSFREGDFRDAGAWRVTNDNRLCTTMTKTNVGIEQCYGLYREGSNVAFERNGARVGSFTVLSGNPQNL